MNRSTKLERFLDFLAGRGFYIILGLCVIAIGVSGYVLLFSDKAPAEDPVMLQNTKTPAAVVSPTPIPQVKPTQQAPVVISPPETEAVPVIKPEPSVPSLVPDETAQPVSTVMPTPVPVPTPKPKTAPVFARPINGEVLRDYNMDELVYHKTLGLWRVHTGMDIAAIADTIVCAAGEGKVVDIYDDPLYGMTVKIDHGDGLVSMYANMNERVSVVIDQLVKLGDAIGTVGETALGESEEESHLHFSMTLNDKPVDPKMYMIQ